MKQESSNGQWKLGQVFVPSAGGCTGHEVEVFNPSVEYPHTLTKEHQTSQEHTITETYSGMVEEVLVRCRVDFKSWHFPAAATLTVNADGTTGFEPMTFVLDKVWEILKAQNE